MSSSPNIKLQSLLRKFKNSKEKPTQDKKYTHDITLSDVDIILDSTYMFQSKNHTDYIYNLLTPDIQSEPIDRSETVLITKSEPIPITNSGSFNSIFKSGFNNYNQSDYSNLSVLSNNPNFSDNSNGDYQIRKYIGYNYDGYLSNVFNTELSDEDWVTFIFLLDQLHVNLLSDNIKIKSLYINTSWSVLSAFNHVIYNSSLFRTYNTTYDWINYNKYDIDSFFKKYKKKYSSKCYDFLEKNIYCSNNINFIVNETTNKLDKINLIICSKNIYTSCVYQHQDKNFISYAILAIKLMDMNSMMMIRIPNIKDWDTPFINILLLYTLIFTEVYVYKFDLVTKSTYLVCVNKKRFNNESIYKKLIHIINNKDFTDCHNLFNKDFFNEGVKKWLDNIISMIGDDCSTNVYGYVMLDTIIKKINRCLETNVYTFA